MKQLKGHESWRVPFLFDIIRHFVSFWPNITGGFRYGDCGYNRTSGNYADGVFAVSYVGGRSSYGHGESTGSGFDFWANRSSTLYGASSTVQPESTRITFIIKY